MQIKIKIRYHFTSVRMASINKSTNNKCWRGCGEREPFCTVGRNAECCSRCGKQYGDTSKIENGSTFWPSYPISGNISEGTQNTNLKEHKHCYVHCSVIYNLHNLEAAQVSINRWVDKTTMGHLHSGILLSRKKEDFILCNSMDGPEEHYAKRNKPVRKTQIPYDFIHM